jgi:DNA-binding NtrC family response regulator
MAVLVVATEVWLAWFIRETLETHGYEVLLTSSGYDAMTMIDSARESIDALITDIQLMNGPIGWHIAKLGRSKNPSLPVIYITNGGRDYRSAQKVPNSLIIRKPFTADQLAMVVSRALDSQKGPQPPAPGP